MMHSTNPHAVAAKRDRQALPPELGGLSIDVRELAREIAAQMAPDALLEAEDIAALIKCSTGYVLERFAKTPGFPPAIHLTGPDGRRGRPRWRRAEISDWIASQQSMQQAERPRRAGTPRLAPAC